MTQPNKAASLPSHFVRADDGCRSSDGGGFPAVPRSCFKRESLPYRHKQKGDIHFYSEIQNELFRTSSKRRMPRKKALLI